MATTARILGHEATLSVTHNGFLWTSKVAWLESLLNAELKLGNGAAYDPDPERTIATVVAARYGGQILSNGNSHPAETRR